MKRKHKKPKPKSTVVDLVDTFKDATGIGLLKEGAKWVAIGAFMGTSDAIPGYSGGTTLALMGFFRRLVLIAKSIFVPEPGITRLKAFLFFLPFGVGWLTGVFGFAKLTELMATNHFGLELMFFFSPFIIFTIPIFLKSEQPKLTKGKKIIKTKRWLWFILGFLIILSVGLYIFLGDDGSHRVDLSRDKSGNDNVLDLQKDYMWLKLSAVAFFAGMVSLIPGGSGALIQLLTGMYPKIHWTIMAHAQSNGLGLVIFGLSTLFGMLTMVFIMAWGLKRHKKTLAALSLGMLIASVGVMFMVPSQSSWEGLDQTKHLVGIPLAVFMGAGLGLLLNLYISHRIKQKPKVIIDDSITVTTSLKK